MVNPQWFEEPSVSLAAVVSPMREVHRRLGGVKQDELMVNPQWSMVNESLSKKVELYDVALYRSAAAIRCGLVVARRASLTFVTWLLRRRRLCGYWQLFFLRCRRVGQGL